MMLGKAESPFYITGLDSVKIDKYAKVDCRSSLTGGRTDAHRGYTLRLFDFSSSVLESISGLPRLGKNMESEKNPGQEKVKEI